MLRATTIAASLLLGAMLLGACEDSADPRNPSSDAGASGEGSGANEGGAGGVPADDALAPCLDRPTDLPRPPVGRLPCELLPPGFGQ